VEFRLRSGFGSCFVFCPLQLNYPANDSDQEPGMCCALDTSWKKEVTFIVLILLMPCIFVFLIALKYFNNIQDALF